MLISEKHNFIFIHVWKVAGTSITKALEKYAYNPDKYLPKVLLNKAGVLTAILLISYLKECRSI